MPCFAEQGEKSAWKQNVKKANKQREISILNLLLQKRDPACSTRLNVTLQKGRRQKKKGKRRRDIEAVIYTPFCLRVRDA